MWLQRWCWCFRFIFIYLKKKKSIFSFISPEPMLKLSKLQVIRNVVELNANKIFNLNYHPYK